MVCEAFVNTGIVTPVVPEQVRVTGSVATAFIHLPGEGRGGDPSRVKRFQPMIDVHLDYVEAELASRPWFAGDAMTAADVMMSFPLEAARARAGLDESRPATLAWLDKIHARPAYQAALKAGGPYAYA